MLKKSPPFPPLSLLGYTGIIVPQIMPKCGILKCKMTGAEIIIIRPAWS